MMPPSRRPVLPRLRLGPPSLSSPPPPDSLAACLAGWHALAALMHCCALLALSQLCRRPADMADHPVNLRCWRTGCHGPARQAQRLWCVRAGAGLTPTPLLALTLVMGASRAGFSLGPACPCGAGAAEAACDTPPRHALSKPLSSDRTLQHLAWSRVALHPPLPPPSTRTAPPACLPACRPSGRRQWRAASGRGPGVFCRHCVLVQPAGGGRGAGGQHHQRGVISAGDTLCAAAGGWRRRPALMCVILLPGLQRCLPCDGAVTDINDLLRCIEYSTVDICITGACQQQARGLF